MKKILIACALAAGLSLVGCASTPSKPLTFDQLGRFSNTPVKTATYCISIQ